METSLYNIVLIAKLEELQHQIPDEFFSKYGKTDPSSKLSLTFTVFSQMNILNISLEDALDNITDNGNDYQIDALAIDDKDDALDIHIFQTKLFKPQNAEKLDDKCIGENDVRLLSQSIEKIMNGESLDHSNKFIENKIEEIRSICATKKIIPYIHIYFVTNGGRNVPENITSEIKRLGRENDNIDSSFINVSQILSTKNNNSYTHKIRSEGSIIEDNKNNIRSIVVNISLKELMDLFNNSGKDKILEENVRGFLGNVQINKKIQKTAQDPVEGDYFWYYNNGISMICESLNYNKDTNGNYLITVQNPKIINGGQTTKCLYEVYKDNPDCLNAKAFVLMRIYQTNDTQLMAKITESTNSQNAVTFKDLNSKNEIQILVQKYFDTKGYFLHIRKDKSIETDKKLVTNENLVQIYLTLYMDIPHQAKTSKGASFRRYFNQIFSENSENIPVKLYIGYKIWEYVCGKINVVNNEDVSLLSHAKYALIYTMKLIDSDILKSENIDEKKLTPIYGKALEILKDIVHDERERLGTAYSHANLFKSSNSTDLINKKLRIENRT